MNTTAVDNDILLLEGNPEPGIVFSGLQSFVRVNGVPLVIEGDLAILPPPPPPPGEEEEEESGEEEEEIEEEPPPPPEPEEAFMIASQTFFRVNGFLVIKNNDLTTSERPFRVFATGFANING